MTLAPDLQIIAPWREWEFRSRTELIEYAQKHRIPVKATPSKPYSTDANLWHISYEGGVLEDPSFPPPEEIFQRTVSPEKAPEEGVEITISWEEGKPVAINGDPLSPATLVQKLNAIAGAHGVGRVDIVEDRFVGIKSRGVYETPAGTVLLFTLRALESLVLEREVRHRRLELMPRYAQLIYNGQWFSPERLALQAFFDSVSSFLTGEVKVKLYKGNIILKSRSSPYSLYQKELSTFEEGKGFSQKDATGFIRLVGAPLSLWGKIQMGKKKE
jgi:argininosuccinate synthase